MVSQEIETSVISLWIARFDYYKTHQLEPHSHPFYQIVYIVKGNGQFYIEPTVYPFQADTLFFIRPNQVHAMKHSTKTYVRTLDTKFEVLDEKLDSVCKGINNVYRFKNQEIKQLLEAIRKEGERKEILYQDICRSLMKLMLFRLIRYSQISSSISEEKQIKIISKVEDQLVNSVQEFIHKHCDRYFTMKELEDKIGFSYRYVNRKFKEYFDCTIIQYIRNCRIHRACHYIAETDLGLRDISNLVGFRNIHHFTRVFKESIGVSPGEFLSRERDRICKDVLIEGDFVLPTEYVLNKRVDASTPDYKHRELDIPIPWKKS